MNDAKLRMECIANDIILQSANSHFASKAAFGKVQFPCNPNGFSERKTRRVASGKQLVGMGAI